MFTTTGKDPLKIFKIDGAAKNVKKVFDKALKGSIYSVEGATTKLQVPAKEKDRLALQ